MIGSEENDPPGFWMKRLLDGGVILRIPTPLLNSTHGRRNISSHPAAISSASFKTMVAVTTVPRLTELTFPITPVPKNPLGEGKYIRTAAALIIGCVPSQSRPPGGWLNDPNSDEILNGKVLDKNTQYFATFCFQQGIDL